jgi:ribosomal protein S21
MANKSNVTIKARQGESAERMIKRFMKLTKKFKILEQVRDRRYYKKKSDVERLAKQKARREMAKNNAKKKAMEKYI